MHILHILHILHHMYGVFSKYFKFVLQQEQEEPEDYLAQVDLEMIWHCHTVIARELSVVGLDSEDYWNVTSTLPVLDKTSA